MRFSSLIDRVDRENLKPIPGDLLDFEGTHYVAEQIGLKYVIAHLASDPAAKAMLNLQQVSKVAAEAPMPPIEDRCDLEKSFPHLSQKRGPSPK